MVSPATFRHPSVLAKMAATLDHISDGRAELGIGAGWLEGEHKAYGFEFSAPAQRVDLVVARVHSGDPAIYGAIHEQIALLAELGLPYEIVPGVSSLGAAAAALGRELTVPEVAQSIVLTRRGGRTPMPAGEDLRELARHGTTMALFLSAARPRELQADLIAGGYPPDTPCAIVHRASWPDERVIRCRLDELGERVRAAGIDRQALVLVGPGLAEADTRSHLYDPRFGHMFRRRASRHASP